MTIPTRGSVWFISHGGPPTIFDTDSKPYKAWAAVGPQILATHPRGLIVVSAHWEADTPLGVQINVDDANPLVHDFYGFPPEFYALEFESRGEAAVVRDVKSVLERGGVRVEDAKRGLDHGVSFPFMVMFGHHARDLPPLVQVSLPGDGTGESSGQLGSALASLRDQGYAIIATGQAVHNLRDFMTGKSSPYGAPFLSAMSSVAQSARPLEGAKALMRDPAFRRAHPTPEHYLPFVVATAAAAATTGAGEGEGRGVRCQEVFVLDQGAIGWGSWRWD